MKKLLISGLFCLLFTTGAHAQFMNGCGLAFGGGKSALNTDLSALGGIVELNGISGESYVGQIGVFCEGAISDRYYLGIEGNYGFDDVSTDLTIGAFTATAETEGYYSVIGKAGVLLNDRTTVYGLFGYGEQQRDDLVTSFGTISLPDSQHFITGGGMNYWFTPNVSLGVEAQYWLEDSFNVGPVKATASKNIWMGKIRYKFGTPPTVDPIATTQQRPLK